MLIVPLGVVQLPQRLHQKIQMLRASLASVDRPLFVGALEAGFDCIARNSDWTVECVYLFAACRVRLAESGKYTAQSRE